MKCVILAGGMGSRLSEETVVRPKPMVEIDGVPIIEHIIKIYLSYRIKDFIICCGYKGDFIKKYFYDKLNVLPDMTIDFKERSMKVINPEEEDFTITCVDTGLNTLTGGRLKRIESLITDDDFALTYGDSIGNVDLNAAYSLHKEKGFICTLTAVQTKSRYGILQLDNNVVNDFKEKKQRNDNWINGGFMFMNRSIFEYLSGDNEMLEHKPIETLSFERKLGAYKHLGFWKAMDTLKDKIDLEKIYLKSNRRWE